MAVGGRLRARWSSIATLFTRLVHGEAETNLATLGRGACLAAGALNRRLVRTKTTDFLKNAFHLKLGLETLERAIYGLAFFDLDFGHSGNRMV